MEKISTITKKNNDSNDTILNGKRILVCGKGGCGKSSIISLIGMSLVSSDMNVIMLDGDASNPGGLCRLLFGNIINPKPLIDFFGGRKIVKCPVDDPSPLTRLKDNIPITSKKIDLTEIPHEYIIENNGINLLQVGKIEQALEGCDGPMSKISRDFIVNGNYVTLLDVEAGIEHFGRGLEQNIDMILIIVDPTFESIFIAEKVNAFAEQMGNGKVWAILNKVRSREIESKISRELLDRDINILGTVNYDPELELAGLMGTKIEKSEAFGVVDNLVEKLVEKFKDN